MIDHPLIAAAIFVGCGLIELCIVLLSRRAYRNDLRSRAYNDDEGERMFAKDKRLLISSVVIYWGLLLFWVGLLGYGYFKTIDGGPLVNPFELEELTEWIDMAIFIYFVYYFATIIYAVITKIGITSLVWKILSYVTNLTSALERDISHEDKKYVLVTTNTNGQKTVTSFQSGASKPALIIHCIAFLIKLAICAAFIVFETIANLFMCLLVFPVLLPIFMYCDKKA